MKKFAIMLLLSLYSIAGGFVSLHQLHSPQGLINKFKQYLTDQGQPIKKRFRDEVSLVIRGEAHPKDNSWCGDVMPGYKIYLPAGLEKVAVRAVARPNSSYYVRSVFVSDDQDYSEQLIPFRTSRMIDVAVIYQKRNTTKGGWLYLRFIQASSFVYSQFGHVDNPRISLSVEYVFKKDNMTGFNNWLKTTYFAPNGDPVEMFSKAYEKSRFCSNYGELIPIYGNTTGTPGSSLVPWLQTDDPSLSIVSDKTTMLSQPTNIIYTINYKTGDKPIDAISVDINNNITDGVLLQNKIDDCMEYVTATKESGKAGKFIYSDNGENWYFNKNDASIMNNIHYIGYLMEDDNPRDGESGQVLAANESGSIKITAKITQDCLSKSSVISAASIKYARDGVEKNVQTSIAITTNNSTTTNVGNASTGISGGGSGTTSGSGNSGNNSGGDDASYYGGNQQSTNTNTTNAVKSDAQKDCENDGGRWVDGTCLRSASNNSSSSSSYSSSISSSSSLSYSGDTTTKHILEVVKKISQKRLPVKGYFVHYAPGIFSWAYKSVKGGFYKLEGMDKKGFLVWKSLKNYFPHAYVKNDQLILGEPELNRDIDTRDLAIIRTIKAHDTYKINGYFTHYAPGPFDWAYVINEKNKIYKLDGMKKDGQFKWLPLTDYVEGVKVEGYKEIEIGKPSPLAKCLTLGGEWDTEDELCIIHEKDFSNHTSSVSSSKSSMSSSQAQTSQAQRDCENDGGKWIDGTCLHSASNNSSSSSSSSSSLSVNNSSSSLSSHIGAFPSY